MSAEIFEILPFVLARRRNVAVAAAAEVHKRARLARLGVAPSLTVLTGIVLRVAKKRNALSLIEKCAKWDGIAYLLKASCENDEEILALSGFAIRRSLLRFNRSFTRPNAEQVAKLKAALETVASRSTKGRENNCGSH